MAVNPRNGKILRLQYRRQQNDVRFEGHNVLRGRPAPCAATSSTAVSPCSIRGARSPRHLNETSTTRLQGTDANPERADASRSPWTWRCGAAGPRCTSPRSARARSASSTRPQLEADTFTPNGHERTKSLRRRPERRRARRGAGTSSTCSRASTTRSRFRHSHAAVGTADVQPGARGRERPALPLRRGPHLEPRRFLVLELPRLRRPRRSAGISATPTTIVITNPDPSAGSRYQPDRGSASARARLPSDEGADDDAEPSRHGE